VDNAWACFNPETGDLTGIFWEKPTGIVSAEIPRSLAESFMSGDLRMVGFTVIEDNGVYCLRPLNEEPVLPEFWNLREAEIIPDNAEIVVSNDTIVVRMENLPSVANLFATLKNAPSWLIKTWNLREFEVLDGHVTINWPNADQHSFYMSNANEE
jgi:hypothetical protein